VPKPYSIIAPLDRCAICGAVNGLELHHVLYGTANRKLADADGLTVMLCYTHHRGAFGIHNPDPRNASKVKEWDLDLKASAQLKWMQYYGKTKEEFIARYGRNYL
jgi:hypothetical protein